ncbi:hypothetical protein [Collimonas sp.]|jgi:hypothetical protein|uniref:defense against restriction DarA-related protein n=1 Tax=Collimonas sp. TaxID=1963772 RepID=UPI002B5E47B6|nr:hypothetical protein [Collimonas sp.]HWX01558.1 hypothetical protein [Collimonas sp.]
MAKNLIFSFDDMGGKKDAATRAVVRYFARAGSHIVQGDVSPNIKRSSGVSYREMVLTFTDSQVVTFSIKQSGDIFQVKLNGKIVPLKNQDDQAAAIGEMVGMMDAGRSKFQAAMAKVRIQLPDSIRTAAPRMEVALQEKSAALDVAIAAITEDIAALA